MKVNYYLFELEKSKYVQFKKIVRKGEKSFKAEIVAKRNDSRVNSLIECS